MNNKFIIFAILFLSVIILFSLTYFSEDENDLGKSPLLENSNTNNSQLNETNSTSSAQIEILAENLRIPWDLDFLSDGDILITERPGFLRKIGRDNFEIEIPDVEHVGEGGLLGLALHPEHESNKWLYLYFTYLQDGRIFNKVVRYELESESLQNQIAILSNIPGASNHNGGRMAFGPDGYLYISTGDAQNPSLAQDTNSLAGKILRLDENGDTPPDNPFNNAVYSYGHRNSQGFDWDNDKRLWATEHGRSGVLSGLDELNLIEIGGNFGWPTIQGDESQTGMISPVAHSGGFTTWAPAGASYFDGSLFFAGLRGSALYEAILEEENIKEINTLFKNEFGRLRHVAVGPDESLYLLSSNTDGRGNSSELDDRLIKIPKELINK